MKLKFSNYLAICCASLIFSVSYCHATSAGDTWKYIEPPLGSEMEHPPLQALFFSPEKPEDVEVTVPKKEGKREFAQLRFGTANSIRVVLMLEQTGSEAPELFVDTKRLRSIAPQDRVTFVNDKAIVSLEADFVENDSTKHEKRSLVFQRRYGLRTSISYAVRGYVEGMVTVNDKPIRARRVDADGNGLLADRNDRIWLDLDGDGKFNPFSEQFPMMSILPIESKRYAVRCNPYTGATVFDRLIGEGNIVISQTLPVPQSEIEKLEFCLSSADGLAVAFDRTKIQETAPIGEYRANSLILTLKGKENQENWTYTFGDPLPNGPKFQLAANAALGIDPIKELKFGAKISNTEVSRGQEITVRPTLLTNSGLRICNCTRGRSSIYDPPASPPHATIRIVNSDGGEVDRASSGFN